MFTPKTLRPLAAFLLIAALAGCEKSLDSPEYGELINRVPPNLNRPYPLPEIDIPTSEPLAKPAPLEPTANETPAEIPGEPASAEATSAEKPTAGEQNHE